MRPAGVITYPAYPGAEGGGAAAPQGPATPRLISSKLAFVVQVIENKSYPADK